MTQIFCPWSLFFRTAASFHFQLLLYQTSVFAIRLPGSPEGSATEGSSATRPTVSLRHQIQAQRKPRIGRRRAATRQLLLPLSTENRSMMWAATGHYSLHTAEELHGVNLSGNPILGSRATESNPTRIESESKSLSADGNALKRAVHYSLGHRSHSQDSLWRAMMTTVLVVFSAVYADPIPKTCKREMQ